MLGRAFHTMSTYVYDKKAKALTFHTDFLQEANLYRIYDKDRTIVSPLCDKLLINFKIRYARTMYYIYM